jgi:hypothetical protein
VSSPPSFWDRFEKGIWLWKTKEMKK